MLSHFSHVQLFVTLWTVAHQALCSWDSPGKNTGAGCHVLLQKKKKKCICICVCVWCVYIYRERQRERKISNHHHNSTLECLHHSHKISLSSSGGHAFLLPQTKATTHLYCLSLSLSFFFFLPFLGILCKENETICGFISASFT